MCVPNLMGCLFVSVWLLFSATYGNSELRIYVSVNTSTLMTTPPFNADVLMKTLPSHLNSKVGCLPRSGLTRGETHMTCPGIRCIHVGNTLKTWDNQHLYDARFYEDFFLKDCLLAYLRVCAAMSQTDRSTVEFRLVPLFRTVR